jgi:hypothetical protein
MMREAEEARARMKEVSHVLVSSPQTTWSARVPYSVGQLTFCVCPAQRVRRNQQNFERNKAMTSTTAATLRSTKPLTIPRSPKMKLAARHGEKPLPTARSAGEPAEVRPRLLTRV